MFKLLNAQEMFNIINALGNGAAIKCSGWIVHARPASGPTDAPADRPADRSVAGNYHASSLHNENEAVLENRHESGLVKYHEWSIFFFGVPSPPGVLEQT